MSYYDTRPVILRVERMGSGGNGVTHVVMTAKEASERVTARLTQGDTRIITVIPVDGVSDAYLESQR